jgi:hypothetical protein
MTGMYLLVVDTVHSLSTQYLKRLTLICLFSSGEGWREPLHRISGETDPGPAIAGRSPRPPAALDFRPSQCAHETPFPRISQSWNLYFICSTRAFPTVRSRAARRVRGVEIAG